MSTGSAAPDASTGDGGGLGLLSIGELGIGFSSGAFTPVDVLEEVLGRARGRARDLRALSLVDEAGARGQAGAAALRWRRGLQLGPFDGVPVTVKDSLAVRGLPSVRGTRLRAGAAPESADEPAVARLRGAGAVIVAKTTMPEYAWSAVSDSPVWGVVRNAWDPERTAGGSSGGAAVATAMGVGAVGLGSDGAGSVRIPASFNGLVGLKATYGRIPAIPSGAFGRLAHVGPITRGVEDAALALDLLAGPSPEDPDSLDAPRVSSTEVVRHARAFVQTLRIGFSADLGVAAVSDEVARVVGEAVEALRAAGVAVDDAEVPLREGSADMAQVWSGVLAAELAGLGETAEAALSPGLRAVLRRGRGLGAVELLRAATRAREGVAPALARFHAGHDVLVTPTVPITAFDAGRQVPEGVRTPEGGEVSWIAWTPLTWPFNLTGQPAVTVPVGVDREGLPVGAQVVARRGHDEDALAVARLLEIVSGLRP
jgi:aspartyl-tRNA(Asn)/glutamyl-tRNA(Gln) amidotransferase subunit A